MHREGWIYVNTIPTHVQTWGGWITDDIPSESVLICISGNPGVGTFYEKFMETLHKNLSMPSWIISHAGLEQPPECTNMKMPSIIKNPDLFNLQGQVEHQKKFITTYVPEGKGIFLIGHSVGGKICAELMKDEEFSSRVRNVYMIFPTLEHIAKAKYGKLFTRFTSKIASVFFAISFVFKIFPEIIKYWFLKAYFRIRVGRNYEDLCIRASMSLLTINSLRVSFFLAKDEMDRIKDLDDEVYCRHADKIRCYYGEDDHWVPLTCFENMKKNHPMVKSVLLDEAYRHAFVLDASEKFAMYLSTDILEDIKKHD